MIKYYIVLLLLAFNLIVTPSAMAEATYQQMFQKIVEINKIKPLQNPTLKQGSKILRWNMLDNSNRVVGEVKDLTLSGSGNISAMEVTFNRIQKDAPVFLNYRAQKIRPASQGYVTNFSANELELIYPSLLSDVEAAAGEAGDVSLNRMMGAKVKYADGRSIGTIKDVLFGGDGDWADAILIAVKSGIIQNKQVAVPFRYLSFSEGLFGFEAEMTTDAADAMLNFAKDS